MSAAMRTALFWGVSSSLRVLWPAWIGGDGDIANLVDGGLDLDALGFWHRPHRCGRGRQ